MLKNTKLIRKFIILSTLVICFGWLTMAPPSEVGAAPCCSTCPLPPGSDQTEGDYCQEQCGANSGTCYDGCIRQVRNCWQWCSFSC